MAVFFSYWLLVNISTLLCVYVFTFAIISQQCKNKTCVAGGEVMASDSPPNPLESIFSLLSSHFNFMISCSDFYSQLHVSLAVK